MNKLKIIFLFLLTTISSFSEIVLDTSNTLPTLREPFQLSIEFIDSDANNYKVEGIENFEILSRGATSKYYSFNGKTSSSKTKTYILKAKRAGQFKLQVVSGKEKSNDITITISDSGNNNSNQQIEKFFISNEIPKREYYFGQKIPFEETFTSTVNIRTFDIVKRPEFNGFSAKDITPNNNGTLIQRKTRVNGKDGFQIILYQGILQANSSGEKFIRSGEAEVREDDYSSFGMMTLPKYIGNQETKISILPLPENKPINFQDVVGTLKGEYNWSSDKVTLGQAITLNIKLFGDVNLDLLEKILPITDTKEFNVYESIKNSKEQILSNGNYWAEKSFEIAFVPKQDGEIITPEIKIPYFNPDTKKYEEYIIPSQKITVTGNISIDQTLAPSPAITTPTQSTETIPTATQLPVETTLLPKGNLPEEVIEIPSKFNYKFLSIILGTILILQAVIFGIFFWKKRTPKNNREKVLFSQLKGSKNDKDFYENYCVFMKEIYNFSPRAHSEERLLKNSGLEELVILNREIQNNIYSNLPLDRKNILTKLKKKN